MVHRNVIVTRKSGYLGRKEVQEKLKNRKRGGLFLAIEQGLLGWEERLLASARTGTPGPEMEVGWVPSPSCWREEATCDWMKAIPKCRFHLSCYRWTDGVCALVFLKELSKTSPCVYGCRINGEKITSFGDHFKGRAFVWELFFPKERKFTCLLLKL